MLSKLATLLSIAAVSPITATRTSPNPGSQSADNSLASTDIYDCLQKGNYICKHRVFSTDPECITSGGDFRLSDSTYICTN